MTAKKNINKKVLNIVKEVKTFCSKLFGDKMQDIYLYGSYARGDYNKYSDVDILVTVNMPDKQLVKYRKNISDINNDLSLKYDMLVSVTTDALKQFKKYITFIPFYQNVLNEGINYGNER